MRERRLDRLDLSVTEGEVALPDEDLRAIARAPLIASDVIPSELDALLTANGLRLPPSHPSRGPLAFVVARAHVQAARIERAREDGRPEIDAPPMPPLVRVATVAEMPVEPDPVRRLSALLERWKRDRRPSTKHMDDKALYLRLFISRYGDLRAGQMTPLMVSQFRDALLQVANNATAVLCNGSFDAIAACRRTRGVDGQKPAIPCFSNIREPKTTRNEADTLNVDLFSASY